MSADGRLRDVDWACVATALDAQGWAVIQALLDHQQADAIAGLHEQDDAFRSRVIMARHGFGRGEYRYFAYPLPPLVQSLREGLYRYLAPLADRWYARMGLGTRFPGDHAGLVARCHAAGQTRPTPLLLQYDAGDYNCLHQDLYGEHVFPLQAAILLSEPGGDFEGGEFVLTEQRPRMQSRASVVPLGKGDAVIFAVRARPVQGGRGDYQVIHRHGVSTVYAGRRRTLGIIFHESA